MNELRGNVPVVFVSAQIALRFEDDFGSTTRLDGQPLRVSRRRRFISSRKIVNELRGQTASRFVSAQIALRFEDDFG